MREMRGVLDGWLCIGWMVVRGCVCTGKQGGVSPCTLDVYERNERCIGWMVVYWMDGGERVCVYRETRWGQPLHVRYERNERCIEWLYIGWMVVRGCVCTRKQGRISSCAFVEQRGDGCIKHKTT